jgi:diguanylate cyclase (GGDEF)-like protein/PAS domain S-box-containing protein
LASTAPVRPVADLADSQRVILDLNCELDAAILRAAQRALRVAETAATGGDPDALRLEGRTMGRGLDSIMQKVAQVARRLTGSDAAVVEMVDGMDAVHRVTVVSRTADSPQGTGGAPDRPWRAPVLTALQVCTDTEADPRVDLEACRSRGTRSLITVPLRHADVGLGAITVASSRPDAFDELHTAGLQLLAGQVAAAAVRLRLITRLRRTEQEHIRALAVSEARFRRLFYENPLPMWVIDGETQRFVTVNDAAVAKYGYSAEEFMARTATTVRRDAAQWATDLGRALAGATTISARHRLRDGRLIDVEVTAGPQEFNGRPAILSIINDVTDRNRMYKQLRDGAFRDPLTGGANRALFAERVAHALTRMRRRSATIAVLVINLKHFKDVNDTMGHAAGDALLQAAAGRIQATLRPGDTVARLGADEFAVLLEDVGHTDGSVEAAERLDAAFRSPLEFAGASLVIDLSIGVTTSSTSKIDAGELLGNAELAMFAAKASARGSVEVFVPSMQATAAERFSVDQDLRHAVERGELRLLLQPLMAMDGVTVTGCEALVRWQHPSRGMVMPDTFIPLAEETGVISDIDAWVLRTACAQVARWRASGLADLRLAVNTSGRDLGRGELVDRVSAALLETGLPSDRLEVEITEGSAVAQPEAALDELRRLRAAGVAVAIDDFGTGYSSLSKLATFPVDRLKIDRSFLGPIKSEADDAPLVAAMIGLAHRLGLQVTAEGVETEEQLAFLRRSGCDLLQGYLFSRPLTPERFEELLRTRPGDGVRL